MSSSVGGLLIDLAVNMARLQSDMAEVRSLIGSSMRSVEGSLNLAKKAFAALGGAAAATKMASFIKDQIDAAAALKDFSRQTGVSVEKLSALASVGKYSNTSIETIAASMVRLNKTLSGTTEDTDKAAIALKAFGLNFDDFKKLAPDEQMMALAKAMNQYADSTDKGVALQLLFGKSGAALLPFFEDLIKLGLQSGSVTDAQAVAAKEFNDKLIDLQKTFSSWAKLIGFTVIPILTALIGGFDRAMKVMVAYVAIVWAIPTAFKAVQTAIAAYIQHLAAASAANEMFGASNWKTVGSLAAIRAEVGLLGIAVNILFGLFAGWQLGSIMRENFVEAEMWGNFFVDGLLVGFERLKFAGKVMWEALKDAFLRVASEIKSAYASVMDAVGRALENIGAAEAGAALREYASEVQSAAKYSSDLDATVAELTAEMDRNVLAIRDQTARLTDQIKAEHAAKKSAGDLAGELQSLLAQMLAEAEAAAAAAAATDQQRKAYDDIMRSINDTVIARKLEAKATEELTSYQKLEADVMKALRNAKVALTKEQREAIRLSLEAAKGELDAADATIEHTEAVKDMQKAIGDQNKDLLKQIEAQKEANDTLGMSTEELARHEVAVLRDKAAELARTVAVMEANGLQGETVELFRQQIEALRTLADEKERGIHIAAAVEARDAWKDTTKEIYEGMTDALFRAFEEGKGFMQAFKDTLVNTFKTLILRPTIEAIMKPVAGGIAGVFTGAQSAYGAMTGTGGGAAGGSGGSGMLGNMTTILGGAGTTFGAGLMGGLGAWGAGIGSAFGSFVGGASAVGSGIMGGSLGATMAGLGTALGAALPVLAAVYALYKGLSMGPKVVKERGIEGAIVGGDATAQLYEKWKQKGGWLRSDKKGTRYKDLPEDVSSALDEATAAIYGQVYEWSDVLGLPAERLADVTHAISIKYGKDDAETQKNIDEAMAGYREALAAAFAPLLEEFRIAGESLVDTMQRLVAIEGVSRILNEFGGIFSRIATSSVEAREHLIGMAGGIEALVQKAQAFVEAYYTAEEQIGMSARGINDLLTSLGIDSDTLANKNDFRALVESMDVNTVEGRQTLAALLDIAPAFAQIADSLGDGTTLKQLAEAAPQTAMLESMFSQDTQSLEVQQQTAQGVEQLDTTLTDVGLDIVGAINALREDTNVALTAIATSTAATARMLDRWDGDGAMNTTVIP